MASNHSLSPPDLEKRFLDAVQYYWDKRAAQQEKQKESGAVNDAGLRSAVTGGGQMAKLEELVSDLLCDAGLSRFTIRTRQSLELPGYYRPEKKWDLVVVDDGQLIAAMEFKSQAGPSFGNNFNNRSEEAIGSATDVWVAYREGRLGKFSGFKPLLGYFFLLEDCPKVRKSVGCVESNFPVDPEFNGASYEKRYEILCKRLVLERVYDVACLTLSTNEITTKIRHPSLDLSFGVFVSAISSQVQRWSSLKQLGSQ